MSLSFSWDGPDFQGLELWLYIFFFGFFGLSFLWAFGCFLWGIIWFFLPFRVKKNSQYESAPVFFGNAFNHDHLRDNERR